MSTTITPERADSAEAILLLSELDASLEPLYPPVSRHGLSIQRLISESVWFYVIRLDNAPAGCGGIQFFHKEYAELKRIYVRPQFRGQGLGKTLINFLIDVARGAGIPRVRLETGIHQIEAIHLYEQLGFYRIPPFNGYTDDPVSLCYEKELPDPVH